MSKLLSISICNLICQSPIINASGPMGWFYEYLPLVDYQCLGAFVLKGLTKEKRRGRQNNRSYIEGSMLTNAIGLENPGIDTFVRYRFPRLCKQKDSIFFKRPFPLVANINGIYEDDYSYLAQKLECLTQIHALEINLSCPNTEKGGLHFIQDLKAIARIIRSVRSCSSKTLIVKLPYLNESKQKLRNILKLIKDEGIDIVSAINSVPTSYFDAITAGGISGAVSGGVAGSVAGGVSGGVSGVAIQDYAISMVKSIKKYVDIPIIGIGGICSFYDLLRFFAAGASIVGIGTGLLYNIKIFSELYRKCEELMLRENLQCIEELHDYAIINKTLKGNHE